jgi:predicted ATPase
MIAKLVGGKTLPEEVVQQIAAKTDGVPLFVEELTKMVLESGLLTETEDRYQLNGPLPPLAIPSTLQDSLMARLDRLATTKELAQLGATLGREFSYDLLHAVSPLTEPTLQQGLQQLVEAELLYQRGTPPQSHYLFKHALIQDTAYQSLLKSRRQQLHQQIAQVLEVQFPQTKETQPELLAYHYTEAGLISHAIPYWQQTGQHAVERSAYTEAIHHFTKGLDILKALPDTLERARQELTLQVALGPALLAAKGWTVPEIEQAYSRACELSQLVGDTSQLFPALWGHWAFCFMRNELPKAHTLVEALFHLAQRNPKEAPGPAVYMALGYTSYALGKITTAQEYFEQGATIYTPQHHHALAVSYGGADPGIMDLTLGASTLWMLGYPKQAQERMQAAISLGQQLSHPHSLAWALSFAAELHYLCRNPQRAQERAEATRALSIEQGFPFWLERVAITRGWALTKQGRGVEGVAQTRQGLAAYRARGAEMWRPHFLAMLAEAYETVGQIEEGLHALTEAVELAQQTGLHYFDAELYRLKGELTLQQENQKAKGKEQKSKMETDAQAEAEACFRKAIEVAQKQQAKSLELRATVSLARLWQEQGKRHAARNMLSEIYNWFTEGFDTKDLQEAKVLLDE